MYIMIIHSQNSTITKHFFIYNKHNDKQVSSLEMK